jgi:hypothetical protein
MGFAAAAVGGPHGLQGDQNCGQCFELRFTDAVHEPQSSYGGWGGSHPELAGKSMVVQVTNIGYDVSGSHSFDLQIPGAGQGIFTNGCTAQFPGQGRSSGDFDYDNNYGGCNDKSGCARLPEEIGNRTMTRASVTPVLRGGCPGSTFPVELASPGAKQHLRWP